MSNGPQETLKVVGSRPDVGSAIQVLELAAPFQTSRDPLLDQILRVRQFALCGAGIQACQQCACDQPTLLTLRTM